ncbi:Hypothetical predicted protein [Pelobates cultripes]|uniref:Uncharacterized protein n=1 Tax=Pelobates cultripes TaxID=61616 RepID=A0AAD1R330_PELCU|nr:Hypothetical predicted protein [Pelobates cultripes]
MVALRLSGQTGICVDAVSKGGLLALCRALFQSPALDNGDAVKRSSKVSQKLSKMVSSFEREVSWVVCGSVRPYLKGVKASAILCVHRYAGTGGTECLVAKGRIENSPVGGKKWTVEEFRKG